MNNTRISRSALLAGAIGLLLLVIVPGIRAQQTPNNAASPEVTPDGQNRQQPELAQLLNLSADQRRQVFAVNQETGPEFRRARQRMQAAQEELDNAIYSDVVDEALVNTKIQQFNQAQNEMVRLRTLREFRIRQILTPEQLTTLRDIREQAKQRADELRRAKQGNGGGQPLRPNGRRQIQPGDQGNQPGTDFRPRSQPATTPAKPKP